MIVTCSHLPCPPFLALQRTEDFLRQECNFFDIVDDEKQGLGGDTEVSSVLSAYKSEGDPAKYEDAYKALHSFIEKSLDAYKVINSLVMPYKIY